MIWRLYDKTATTQRDKWVCFMQRHKLFFATFKRKCEFNRDFKWNAIGTRELHFPIENHSLMYVFAGNQHLNEFSKSMNYSLHHFRSLSHPIETWICNKSVWKPLALSSDLLLPSDRLKYFRIQCCFRIYGNVSKTHIKSNKTALTWAQKVFVLLPVYSTPHLPLICFYRSPTSIRLSVYSVHVLETTCKYRTEKENFWLVIDFHSLCRLIVSQTLWKLFCCITCVLGITRIWPERESEWERERIVVSFHEQSSDLLTWFFWSASLLRIVHTIDEPRYLSLGFIAVTITYPWSYTNISHNPCAHVNLSACVTIWHLSMKLNELRCCKCFHFQLFSLGFSIR